MNKYFLTALLLMQATASFAQRGRLITDSPLVNGAKLGGAIEGNPAAQLFFALMGIGGLVLAVQFFGSFFEDASESPEAPTPDKRRRKSK